MKFRYVLLDENNQIITPFNNMTEFYGAGITNGLPDVYSVLDRKIGMIVADNEYFIYDDNKTDGDLTLHNYEPCNNRVYLN